MTVKVFFYGTLKRGGYFFESYNLGASAIRIRKAELEGYALYQDMYPYVEKLEGASVKGELHEYPITHLMTFDAIEGYPYLYDRVELPITLENGVKEKAFVYVPADRMEFDGERVEGDEYDVSN